MKERKMCLPELGIACFIIYFRSDRSSGDLESDVKRRYKPAAVNLVYFHQRYLHAATLSGTGLAKRESCRIQ